ncbi:MAG: acetolactate synthase small subunit [Rhodobacteraceae bacterium]|nr:acetolactate synthase small subunit [Paracoccaceae bacterium]
MSEMILKKGSSRKSAYDLRKDQSYKEATHTFSILVDNEAGVLARIVDLFAGRGFNIESLTVTEVDHTGHRSRITIVSTGGDDVIQQIRAQVQNVIPVHEIFDLTTDGPSVARELALHVLKVREANIEAARAAAQAFQSKELGVGAGCLVFEQSGTPHEIDELFDRLRPLGELEVARTGVVGLKLPQ